MTWPVPQSGTELPAPTVDELRQFIADRVAAYKVPERIVILPELPLNATGKVDRKKLHEMVAEKSDQ